LKLPFGVLTKIEERQRERLTGRRWVDDEKTLLLKFTEMIFDKLKQFRQSAYTLLGKGKMPSLTEWH
jgi:hypothetical protein